MHVQRLMRPGTPAEVTVMVAVAATERGLMMSALGYTWTAASVAFFFRPNAARRYAALIIAALGLSLLLERLRGAH